MHPRPNTSSSFDRACLVEVFGAFVSAEFPEAGTVRTEAAMLTLAPTLVTELSLCRYTRTNRYVAKVGGVRRVVTVERWGEAVEARLR